MLYRDRKKAPFSGVATLALGFECGHWPGVKANVMRLAHYKLTYCYNLTKHWLTCTKQTTIYRYTANAIKGLPRLFITYHQRFTPSHKA